MKAVYDFYIYKKRPSETPVTFGLDSIKFEYEDIRGTGDAVIDLKRTPQIAFPYQEDGYYHILRITCYTSYNSADVNGIIALTIHYLKKDKTTGAETYISLYFTDATMSNYPRGLNFFGPRTITGYTTGILKLTINFRKDTGLAPFKTYGVKLSGLVRRYAVDTFTNFHGIDGTIMGGGTFKLTNRTANEINCDYEIYYAGKNKVNKLGRDNSHLTELEYNEESVQYYGNVDFCYVLKNVYPCYGTGKINFVNNLRVTAGYNMSVSDISYQDVYCKNIEYSKRRQSNEREMLFNQLDVNVYNFIEKIKENGSGDIQILPSDISEIIFEEDYRIIKDKIITYLVFDKEGQKIKYFLQEGTHNISDENINITYTLIYENLRIYCKITNNDTVSKLRCELQTHYTALEYEGVPKLVINKISSELNGAISYSVNNSFILSNKQVRAILDFMNFYNQKSEFVFKDIVTNSNFGWYLTDILRFKIIDPFRNKKIIIVPFSLMHELTEDLITETSIQGKIIGEEDI